MLHHAIVKLVIRVTEGQAKNACGSLQLCAGLEASIEGATHAVSHRRQERTTPAPEERLEEDLEEGSTAAEYDEVRDGIAAAVGGVVEVPEPPGVRQATVEGGGGVQVTSSEP